MNGFRANTKLMDSGRLGWAEYYGDRAIRARVSACVSGQFSKVAVAAAEAA